MTDEELMQKIKDADFSKLVEVLGAYEKGLADAWECARKLGQFNQLMLEDAGFVIKEEYENGIRLDWNPSFYVINKYSASEAIKRIKEYEERHKREKAIKEWLSIHCPKCANNDDRGTEFVNCQAECEVQKDVGIACIHYEYVAESEEKESDIEKRKPCINYSDGCEEWNGCPCVYYKAESEG